VSSQPFPLLECTGKVVDRTMVEQQTFIGLL